MDGEILLMKTSVASEIQNIPASEEARRDDESWWLCSMIFNIII